MRWLCSMMSKSVSTTTMPTPIRDLTPTPEVPSGFPDVATLARMANAFFTALPGAAAAAEGGSTLERPPADITITDPSVASGVTRGALATAPGAAIAGAPAPPPAPAHPAPSSPFYFLDYVGSGWDTLSGSTSGALNNIAAL